MKAEVESHWTTEAGLEGLVVLISLDEVSSDLIRNDKWRTGYVKIPEGHPLYGIEYNDKCPSLGKLSDLDGQPAGDRGVIPLFVAAMSGDISQALTPELYFDVHGSLTFSGTPHKDVDGFWYGFDCNHADDNITYWTNKHVAQEVERLAKQIAAVEFLKLSYQETEDEHYEDT